MRLVTIVMSVFLVSAGFAVGAFGVQEETVVEVYKSPT